MLFGKAEGLSETERAQHIQDILYQFYKNPTDSSLIISSEV